MSLMLSSPTPLVADTTIQYQGGEFQSTNIYYRRKLVEFNDNVDIFTIVTQISGQMKCVYFVGNNEQVIESQAIATI